MFVWENFVVYNDLTQVQVRTTCVENISCLIFAIFDDCEIFLTTKFPELRHTTISFTLYYYVYIIDSLKGRPPNPPESGFASLAIGKPESQHATIAPLKSWLAPP